MIYRSLFGCLLACSLWAQAPATPASTAPASTAPQREPGLYVTIDTTLGQIVGKLYEKESPQTVKNFVDLATGKKTWVDPKTNARVKRPLYNGLIFHRVIPGFMIQTGDPEGTGQGGTDVIPDEINPSLSYDKPGVFGMANAGPQTGSSQFFITEVPTPHLNGRHAIFGQVIQGQDVVSKIASVPRDPDNRPNTPVKMVKVTVQRVADPSAPAPAVVKPKPAKPKAAKPAASKPSAAKPAATKPAGTKPASAKPKPADPVK